MTSGVELPCSVQNPMGGRFCIRNKDYFDESYVRPRKFGHSVVGCMAWDKNSAYDKRCLFLYRMQLLESLRYSEVNEGLVTFLHAYDRTHIEGFHMHYFQTIRIMKCRSRQQYKKLHTNAVKIAYRYAVWKRQDMRSKLLRFGRSRQKPGIPPNCDDLPNRGNIRSENNLF